MTSALSRFIAHLMPISVVPSDLDKYSTPISVDLYFRYLVFPLFRIYGIPTFHVFHFEVPDSHPDMIEFIQLQTSP